MATNALEISSSSARRLSNALAVGFKNASHPGVDEINFDNVVSSLKEVHPLAPMPLTRQPAAANELIACWVWLDQSTGDFVK